MSEGRSDARSDFELVTAWRTGDATAGQLLFQRHFRRIYRFFEAKIAGDVDELVQATFLACVRAKEQFRGDSAFSTYVHTIARHELYRALSARRRDLDRRVGTRCATSRSLSDSVSVCLPGAGTAALTRAAVVPATS